MVVCAAGNSNKNIDVEKVYPACLDCENIISVGAMTIDNKKWFEEDYVSGDYISWGSNYGNQYVDLFAPGKNILSITFDKTNHVSDYTVMSGTSFACPYVTGVAALVMSMYPDMSTTEIKYTVLLNVTKHTAFNELSLYDGYLNAYTSLSNPHYHNYQYEYYDSNKHYCYCTACNYGFYELHEWTALTRIPIFGSKRCLKCYAQQII